MGAFRTRLEAANARGERGRRWIFVAYDQLTSEFGPLARTPPCELGIVVVEAPLKAERRPYHKRKLALVLANLRHFAIEQAARGVAVRHVVAKGTYGDVLVDVAREVGPLDTMVPAERELRVDLAEAVERGAVRYVPHEGWLTTRDDFLASHHRDVLEDNPRMRLPIASAARRSRDDKRRDARTFERVREGLVRGERLKPEVLDVEPKTSRRHGARLPRETPP